jgi:hypothetical protein
LTEKECLAAFPVVRVAIELILDERIEVINRKEKLETIAKSITELRQKHA